MGAEARRQRRQEEGVERRRRRRMIFFSLPFFSLFVLFRTYVTVCPVLVFLHA